MILPECEICGWHRDLEAHHIVVKGMGGRKVDGPLLTVCRECHRMIHDDPATSYEKGWMVRRMSPEGRKLLGEDD